MKPQLLILFFFVHLPLFAKVPWTPQDEATFNRKGKSAQAFLTQNQISLSEVFAPDMRYESWSETKRRESIVKAIKKQWQQGKRRFAFPIIDEEELGSSKVSIGKRNRKFFQATWSDKRVFLVLDIPKWSSEDVPWFNAYLASFDTAHPIRGGTFHFKGTSLAVNRLNFAKFMFPRIPESWDPKQCLKPVQYFLAEFNRTRKIIRPKTQLKVGSSNVTSLEISNNCREPGNLEIRVRGGNSAKAQDTLLAGYVKIPMAVYEQFIYQWTGRYPHQMGIRRDRFAALDTRSQPAVYRYLDLPTDAQNKLAECNIDALQALKQQSKMPVRRLVGKTNWHSGTIPMSDLPTETQRKMAFNRPDLNSYQFIKINRDQAPPSFLIRGNKSSYALPHHYFTIEEENWVQHSVKGSALEKAVDGRVFWELARKQAQPIFVPHRFARYDEMFSFSNNSSAYWSEEDPNILPSAFEVDGRYGAEQKIEVFAAPRLWSLELGFLPHLVQFEAQAWNVAGETEPRIELKLVCDGSSVCQKKITNLIIGNLALKPGETKELLLGLAVEPLQVEYVRQGLPERIPYALAYDKKGRIQNHNPEIGKIVVTRGTKRGDTAHPDIYTVDIITDDRIHALARASFDLGPIVKDVRAARMIGY